MFSKSFKAHHARQTCASLGRPRHACRSRLAPVNVRRTQMCKNAGRSCPVPKSSLRDCFGNPEGQEQGTTVEEAAQAVEECLRIICARDLDALIDFVPDEVIDDMLQSRKSLRQPEPLTFADVLQFANQKHLYLDTFSVRNLVHSAPTSVKVLSSLRVSYDKYLQRCLIVSPSGEECILSFTLTLQDCLQPRYRSAPTVAKCWRLRAIIGEADCTHLPAHPSPSFPPEAVVEAQLQALRANNVAAVFAFASPENKSKTGPVERFAAMLQHSHYKPLVRHTKATSLRRLQISTTAYMELVEVVSCCPEKRASEPFLYVWVVSKQPETSAFPGSWMIDAVHPATLTPIRLWGG